MVTRSLLILSVVLAVTLSCTSHSLSQSAIDLKELEQRIAAAWVSGDQATIDAIFADDWTVTDIAGQVQSKADVLGEMFGPQSPQFEDMTIDDVGVRLLDDVAVITGRTTAIVRGGATVVLRFTDVAVQHGGQWQIVASQGTRIEE